VPRLQHDVARGARNLAGERADRILVLDEQDRLPAGRSVALSSAGWATAGATVGGVHLEYRPVPRLAVDQM